MKGYNANDSKILDRVRKMLALANDEAATDGERDNALRMAHATLMKYQLSLADLDAHTRERVDPRERFDTEGWNLTWCKDLRAIIARLFFCEYLSGGKINATRGRHIYIGRASNVTTAAYMADWIILSILREADKRYKHRLTPEGRSFCVGAVHQLAVRVRSILASSQEAVNKESTGTSLVVADYFRTEMAENASWIAANMRVRTVVARRKAATGEAYSSGRQFGNSINLNKQIATTAAPKQIK